jgi:hypothetical protein
MKAAVNITWNGRPTHYWLRARSWGRQMVRRAARPGHPAWLAKLRLSRAEWVTRGKDVKAHMRELDAALVPAFSALLDRLENLRRPDVTTPSQ